MKSPLVSDWRRTVLLSGTDIWIYKVIHYRYVDDDTSYYSYPYENLLRDYPDKRKDLLNDDERLERFLHSPAQFYSILDDASELHSQVGPLYEVLTYRLQDAADGISGLSKVAVQFEPREVSPPATAIEISAPLMLEYPILWAPEAIILSPQTFDILGPCVDRVHFLIGHAQL